MRHNHRIPAQYRDFAPRLVELPTGGNAFLVEGGPVLVRGGGQFAGKAPEEYVPNYFHQVRWDADSPGFGSPEDRVRDLDRDGIDAEIQYASTSFLSLNDGTRVRDPKAYCAMVRAYNEWLAEEYCAVAPDRLIGMGVIPCAGVDDAIAEMEYCLKLGLKGVALGSFPSGRSNPTPEDDKFWAAAIDLNAPVTIHGAIRDQKVPGDRFRHPREDPGIIGPGVGGAGDFRGHLAKYARGGGHDAVKLMVTGVFDRFPKLKIYWAENQVGWIPNFLEQMDKQHRVHRYWGESVYGVKLSRRPSEYVRDQCYWGFMYNPVGVEMRHHIGVDRIMWGADFPHTETDWPHSLDILDEIFAGVPEEEKYKMVCGNIIEFFHLENRVNLD